MVPTKYLLGARRPLGVLLANLFFTTTYEVATLTSHFTDERAEAPKSLSCDLPEVSEPESC